jgi:7,8-dihydropterin-6-yl-methyl-4-(beta-D-ribofuranosyl)aminobenzene 5'-phosphate synthase
MRPAVVYDNRSLHGQLSPAWGFSCLVGDDLLFDTGGDGPRLVSNMAKPGYDPRRIRSVVLSHAHGDHTRGLESIISANRGVTVYLPRSFPLTFKEHTGAHARVVEVCEPMEIAEGIYTTGEIKVRGRIIEQSLVIATSEGLVLVTGCAHPGIVRIMRRAAQMDERGIHLVLGGFHLSTASPGRIARILSSFRELGVQRVAPCHCTGKSALRMFATEYGEDFVEAGVGLVLDVGSYG